MNAREWKKSLAAYRRQFIRDQIRFQGWSKKNAASYIRDAWATLDEAGCIQTHTKDVPANAVPCFQFWSPPSWRLTPPLYLNLVVQLRESTGVVVEKSNGPQKDHVLRQFIDACLNTSAGNRQISEKTRSRFLRFSTRATRKTSGEAEDMRRSAAEAARDVLISAEDDALSGVSNGDPFWIVVEAAVQFGRRELLAEMYSDEPATEQCMRAQLYNQKGKNPKRKNRKDPLANIKALVRQKTRIAVGEGKVGPDTWPRVEKLLRKSGVSFYEHEGKKMAALGIEDEEAKVYRREEVQVETLRKWISNYRYEFLR